MAVDRPLEDRIRRGLHQALDGAIDPYPTWDTSPAARAVRAREPASVSLLRPRAATLIAAGVLIALLAGAIALSAGTERTRLIWPSPGGLQAVPAPSSTATPPGPRPSPSATFAIASASAAACEVSWSSRGTVDPRGQVDGIRIVDFSADSGQLAIIFGHDIATVQAITIRPVEPPFADRSGKAVSIAGRTFLELSIRGLTGPTQDVPEDTRADHVTGRSKIDLAPPVVELRRIGVPRRRSPLEGPSTDSTETWLIGLEGPVCVNVRTMTLSGYGGDPGTNAVLVSLTARP